MRMGTDHGKISGAKEELGPSSHRPLTGPSIHGVRLMQIFYAFPPTRQPNSHAIFSAFAPAIHLIRVAAR